MPKRAPELTALQVRKLTAPGRYAVGGWGVEGLQLEVKDTGARSWVLRILLAGRRRSIGLGGYPLVSLEDARDRARELKKVVASGGSPLAHKAATKQALAEAVSEAISFEQAARSCHAARSAEFKNAKHAAQWINTLQTYAFPVLGPKPVDRIETQDVLAVLQPIWQTKTETATRVRQRMEAVLNWARAAGHRPEGAPNPAQWAGHLSQLLPKPTKLKQVEHHAALPYAELPAFMAELRANKASVVVRALEFLILTAARTGEVRGMEWKELTFQDGTFWTVPATRMKAGKSHRVPLGSRAMEVLRNSWPQGLDTASGPVFPGLHENSLNNLLETMGYKVTAHGFRSTFKDYCREVLGAKYTDEASELALAHVSDDKTRAAYARGELMDERRRLMEDWAAYCGSAC